MANERRRRYQSGFGLITNNPLTNVATTMNSAELANLPAVTSESYLVVVLDPLSTNPAFPPEIVYVTAHTASATSATIVRGREGTSARQHNLNTRWSHSATPYDFDYGKTPLTRMYARANFR